MGIITFINDLDKVRHIKVDSLLKKEKMIDFFPNIRRLIETFWILFFFLFCQFKCFEMFVSGCCGT